MTSSPRPDLSSTQSKVKKIIGRLVCQYPNPHTFLAHETPLQLLVATILSAQCTDKKVNEVTAPLFRKYRTAEDFAGADPAEFEQAIRQTGFFRNKAKNIIAAAERICTCYGGRVPQTMPELLTLPGVARKTANIVLSSAFHISVGIAVDTHVKRLSGRLGLSSEKNPDKIERDLLAVVPEKNWIDVNYLFIEHGRKVCDARKPLCEHCVLRSLCPWTKAQG